MADLPESPLSFLATVKPRANELHSMVMESYTLGMDNSVLINHIVEILRELLKNPEIQKMESYGLIKSLFDGLDARMAALTKTISGQK